ncbi:Apoptosis regulation Bcl-2 family protein [Lymphocystis disease virus 1]|uniref:Apoptosis regulation Bcl-2 family protein n=1 Tax=Fish lymphocystis disease virus TaxID=36363 RepID=UPI0000161EEB|nr:Apoptosis regulation Bcl-2 family protein [Lymphocystis disease virus 1]
MFYRLLNYLHYSNTKYTATDLLFSICNRKLNMPWPEYLNKCNFNHDTILCNTGWPSAELIFQIHQLTRPIDVVLLYKCFLVAVFNDKVINKGRIIVCIYLAYEMITLVTFRHDHITLIIDMSKMLDNFVADWIRTNGTWFHILQ